MAAASSAQLALFREITDKVTKKEITAEEGENQIKNIDFQQFNIDEMDEVQQSTWLSDATYVDIMRSWVRQQDNLLLQLRAYHIVNSEIATQRLIDFVEAVKNPSQKLDISVDNVIKSLSTAGGTRDPINPITYGLIKAKSSCPALQGYQIDDIYSLDNKYFKSQPNDNAAIIITLPSFLKIQLEKYSFSSPYNSKGLRSWSIDATNDPKEEVWTNIDTKDLQEGNNPFVNHNTSHTFDVTKHDAGFFRTFKISLLCQTLMGNPQMIMKNLDFSGKLIISMD